MSNIKVISSRVLSSDNIHKGKKMLNMLHIGVQNNPGFINSETNIEYNLYNNNYIKLWTFSYWDSMKSWKLWQESQMRNEIISKHKFIIHEKHAITSKLPSHNWIF
jgi:antibiotic biosynthesis monooxygenase (ABM) superfamily enzyme